MKNLIWKLIKVYLIIIGLLYRKTFTNQWKAAMKHVLDEKGYDSFLEFVKDTYNKA